MSRPPCSAIESGLNQQFILYIIHHGACVGGVVQSWRLFSVELGDPENSALLYSSLDYIKVCMSVSTTVEALDLVLDSDSTAEVRATRHLGGYQIPPRWLILGSSRPRTQGGGVRNRV